MSILGTKEWMPHSENCISGCSNDCRYCYAKIRAIRYRQKTAENWPIMVPNKRSQKPVRYLEGGVMFPTTHDLHIEHADIWLPFLRSLLEAGNDVLIVTKAQFSAIDTICEDLVRFKDQIEFRLTIGTDDDNVAAYWELGAPTPTERLSCLRYLHNEGYKSSVSMEPLLISSPKRFIDAQIRPWISGTIWVGLMNYHKFDDAIPQERYQHALQSRQNMEDVYWSLKCNDKIRWKDSVQDLLGITQTGERVVK